MANHDITVKRSVYDKTYNQSHSKQYSFKLETTKDADLIQELAAQESVNGYIKRLIREDIASRSEDPDAPAMQHGLTERDVKALFIRQGGEFNHLYAIARETSYRDPDHLYTVCSLIDGSAAIICGQSDQQITPEASAVLLPVYAYHSEEKLTQKRIKEEMKNYNPIFDRLDGTSTLQNLYRDASTGDE